MILYRIRDWEKRYENAQSRKCEQLHWLPLPARHDSERYCELIMREDGAEIFAAWIMCLQVGARSQPRGSLVRSDGTPHTPETLSLKTRGSAEWFKKALPYLSKIGWLTSENFETGSQLVAEWVSDSTQLGKKEGRKPTANAKRSTAKVLKATGEMLKTEAGIEASQF